MSGKIPSSDHTIGPHTIGALGKLTGVNVETIRYYERIGLLAGAARSSGNYRIYDDRHVKRLTFIRKARDLGFPLEAVRRMLALSDQPDRPCAEVDDLVVEQMGEVERKIADLTRLRDELARLAHQCRGGLVSDCRIIEALSP
ncbi:MerR family transcriptional regulator [Skermanella stibiiresistens]|uniref:MerR family transcriptional regulator n=1 Tax=Skermanella stibiiresistens TaxID=913326 RepID=UPI0004BC6A03|nr:helix-turn-helix domain-containing protein [Skermanella stibiiresistens]